MKLRMPEFKRQIYAFAFFGKKKRLLEKFFDKFKSALSASIEGNFRVFHPYVFPDFLVIADIRKIRDNENLLSDKRPKYRVIVERIK